MNIITNNIPRPLVCLLDLPEKARADFDYLDDPYECRLVQYKGVWYDVWDSMRCPTMDSAAPRNPLSGWDGYISGVLFRLADDDCVVVGQYFS